MKKSLFVLIALVSNVCSAEFPSFQTEKEVISELAFLTDTASQVGFTYNGTAGALKGLALPLSYYSTADYWAKYVGTLPGNDLTVVDVYNAKDYTLTPTANSPGKDLQVERVNVFNGTDIYDAACWQIALGVCGRAGLKSGSGQNLFTLAENQNALLQIGYDGDASLQQAGANRAVTRKDGTFSYNGKNISTPKNAYFFRMVTKSWLSIDPFMGTPYMKYITAKNLPSNPEYKAGKITWLDWKPITGENAWGFFIGPLQTAYLKQQAAGLKYVPYSSIAVQNALDIFLALRCMQSELGGIYYACKGSLGNQGNTPVNPYEVSVENNASALASVLIFKEILKDELAYETGLTSAQKSAITNTLNDIDAMINGGKTPQGKDTKGLLAFFKKNAWDDKAKCFYQGGEANNPKLNTDWKPTSEPKAVDVSTWGVSVLGQPLIDSWYGFGTSYKIWESVKEWGGFFGPEGGLWGVGYSDKDGNGKAGHYEKGIISAEWTAGAINMLRCLITQYKFAAESLKYSSNEQELAKQYVQELEKDHDSMCKNILTLRSDLYPASDAYATVRPADYTQLLPIPDNKLAFVYASKRYMIPFGWFANPLPSTTSTAWAIMLHYNFNPFKIGGDYTPYTF